MRRDVDTPLVILGQCHRLLVKHLNVFWRAGGARRGDDWITPADTQLARAGCSGPTQGLWSLAASGAASCGAPLPPGRLWIGEVQRRR